MIQFRFSSEVWLGFDLKKNNPKHSSNGVIAAGPDAAHDNNVTILPLDSFFFTNTRRHNNASGFICMKNMGVIVSTGKAEMSLIPNSMMKP